MRSAVLLCLVFAVLVSAEPLGDGLWRTFNLALLGKAPTLPLTISEAESQDWQRMGAVGDCDPSLGIRYAYKDDNPGKSTPLTIYYTAAGQIAGMFPLFSFFCCLYLFSFRCCYKPLWKGLSSTKLSRYGFLDSY